MPSDFCVGDEKSGEERDCVGGLLYVSTEKRAGKGNSLVYSFAF